MKILDKWRRDNGLDYNGWLAFIVKRKLRRIGLGFLVPFNMQMDWENSSNVTVGIWEWGKYREERYRFHIDYPLATDFISKLRDKGLTSSRAKYQVIQAIGYRK